MLSLIHPNRWTDHPQDGTEALRLDFKTPVAETPTWLRTLARIPREAARPEMLVGMALGAGLFQAGRILGLRSLLGLGIRGPLALGLGRGAGLLTESAGFVAASHGVSHLAGRPVKTDAASLAKEWISLGMFLGAMRLTHGAVRQSYGLNWLPQTPWQKFHFGLSHQGAILATTVGTALVEQSLSWRKYTDGAHLLGESLAMMGTFQLAGSWVNRNLSPHLSPMLKNLEGRVRGLEKKTQSAMTLPDPYALAGAFAGGGSSPIGEGSSVMDFGRLHMKESRFGGKGGEVKIASAESVGEQNTEAIRFFRAIGPGEIVRHIDDAKVDFLNEVIRKDVIFRVEGSFNKDRLASVVKALNKKIMPNGKSHSLPPNRRVMLLFIQPELNQSLPQLLEFPLGENGFSVPKIDVQQKEVKRNDVDDLLAEAERILTDPKAEPSRRAPETTRSRQEPSLLNIGEAHLPITADSFGELSRKVRGHPDQIQDRLKNHDVSIVFKSGIGFKTEFALNVLNELPRLDEIPGGRTVIFSWPGNTNAAAVFKQGEQFVDGTNRQLVRPTPPSTKRNPVPASEQERVALPSSDHPFDKDSKNDVWKDRHLPPLFDDLTHLPNYLKKAAQTNYPGSYPILIYEKRKVDLPLLEKVTAEMSGLETGTFWELMVPSNSLNSERSFMAVAKDGKVKWHQGSPDSWDNAKHQAPFSKRIIKDAAEIYQHVEALSRINEGNLGREVTFQHRGNMSQQYVEQLGPFLEATLNLYGVKDGKIFVLDQMDQKVLELYPKTIGSGWRYKVEVVSPLLLSGK